MCGNGGRCLVKFAYHMGIHKTLTFFRLLMATMKRKSISMDTVSLKMVDVYEVKP